MSAMAQDYVLHGDFVQFTGSARCKACQAKDLKCALQQSDEGCMACAGANQDCNFTRIVEITAVKPNLAWETLLHGGRKQEVVTMQTPAPSIVTSTTPFQAGTGYWQPRQGKMSEPTNKPASEAENDEEEILIRPDARNATPPETSRSGINPTDRNQLGDIPNLADQERQRELALSNAHVKSWLDEGLSDSMEHDPQRASMSSPKPFEGKEIGSESESQSESMRHPQSPSDIAFPNTGGGVLKEQSPTLKAHPWLESLRIPSLDNSVSQPATANEAMWWFAERANSIETASRSAVEGESSAVVDERHLGLLIKNLTLVGRQKILGQLQGSSRFENVDNTRAALWGLANSGSPQIRPYVISHTPQRHEKAGNDSVLEPSGSFTRQATSPSGSAREINPDAQKEQYEERPKDSEIEREKAPREDNMGHAKKRQRHEEATASVTTRLISVASLPQNSPGTKRNDEFVDSGIPDTSLPGYDKFKHEILRPYPRIMIFLLERLTQEQVRRYEKLRQLKDNHARMRQQAKCPSGTHCLDQDTYSRWVETALNPTMTNISQSPNHWTPL